MAVQQRVYDVHDLWHLVCQAENADKHFELINGEIIEMVPPGGEHGFLAFEIGFYIRLFDRQGKLGVAMVETGFHPPDDRTTVLSPDFAFTLKDRAPQPIPKNFMPLMPDLAVEVISPSNTMPQVRRKAAIYLKHGTQLVWIVIPDNKGVEVCRLDAEGKIQSEFVGENSALSGESVLPGFSLNLSSLFS